MPLLISELAISSAQLRFCHDNAKDDTIGIGFTFITPEFWGKGVNDEIKHTLLNHAFKYRNAVCFQIHEGNDRSKKR